MLKRCTSCGVEKTLDEFYHFKNRPLHKSAHPKCKPCFAIYNKMRLYGMSQEDYQALRTAQGGACALCRLPPSGPGRNSKVLHVDHDHETGRTRGLLCSNCNTALGKFKDDAALMRSAASYIESHRDRNL